MVLKIILVLLVWLPCAAGGDPLGELDAAFHAAYAAARAEALARQGPVMVVSGDKLILYRDQAVVAEAVIRPALYHRLKGLSHVPLAIRLAAGGEGALDEGRAARLAALREKIAALGTTGREGILGPSLRFLDGVMGRKALGRGEVDAYCSAMGGALDALASRAAALELDALEAAVGGWRREHLTGDWGRVRVVVIGSHMAREGEVSWQFFARLLGEAREGGRLVFAEEKWDPREAMGLLASHTVDGDLGRAFFGDPRRMHRDVLALGAKKWLDSHPLPR